MRLIGATRAARQAGQWTAAYKLARDAARYLGNTNRPWLSLQW